VSKPFLNRRQEFMRSAMEAQRAASVHPAAEEAAAQLPKTTLDAAAAVSANGH
jgi:hypothetical protein